MEQDETVGFAERLRLRRDSLLASRRFQRWASRFPLTRWMARRRARQLFDVIAGFVYSQVLVACVRLGVFDLVTSRPAGVAAISKAINAPEEETRRLLDAAVATRLLRRVSGDRYALGELGAALKGQSGLVAMIDHHELLYRDLADPVKLLQTPDLETALQKFWSYAAAPGSADPAAGYTELMAATNVMVADMLMDAYPVQKHQRLMDVGGGNGSFLRSVAAQHAHLKLVLFDLPDVTALARDALEAADMVDRVDLAPGSFVDDDLPTGSDLITLVRILHDHDDDVALELLKKCRRALAPGGRLVIAEPMSRTRGAETMGDAYFGLYLLAMRQGRPRTEEEISHMLRTAGFREIRAWPTNIPLQIRVLSAAV